VTFFQAFLTFISVFIFSAIFMNIFGLENVFPISIVLGAIAMATAPATVVAMIDEFKAKGPLTTLLLTVVALDDGIAIIVFSLVLMFAAFLLQGIAAQPYTLLMLPLKELLLPILIGLVMGGMFILMTRKIRDQNICGVSLIVSAVLLLFLSEYLKISPLISAMILGFFAGNFAGLNEETLDRISRSENLIFIFFFLTAGASLRLGALYGVGLLALVYVLARWAGKVLGGAWGARLSGADEKVQRWLGWGLLPQAGVAIAFVHMTARILPQISETVMAIVLASIVLDEIIGPLGVELALFRSGEARRV
jgi:Kef-type K+ transport system membrane component KefB